MSRRTDVLIDSIGEYVSAHDLFPNGEGSDAERQAVRQVRIAVIRGAIGCSLIDAVDKADQAAREGRRLLADRFGLDDDGEKPESSAEAMTKTLVTIDEFKEMAPGYPKGVETRIWNCLNRIYYAQPEDVFVPPTTQVLFAGKDEWQKSGHRLNLAKIAEDLAQGKDLLSTTNYGQQCDDMLREVVAAYKNAAINPQRTRQMLEEARHRYRRLTGQSQAGTI